MTSPKESAIPRYRQELKKALPAQYLKPDNLHILWYIPHLAIIGASLWIMTVWFTWWLAPLLSIVIGHSFACMGFLAHEICHGGGIKNRALRHFLAGIGFSPFGIGPHLWARWHNAAHHNHTQDEELDPDRLFTIDEYAQAPFLKFLYRLSPVMRNLVIFSSFSFRMSQHNAHMADLYLRDRKTTASERLTIIWQFALPTAIWIVGASLLGWQVLLLGYVAPLAVANFIVICYIATNHFLNPLADQNDVLATSLSVTLPGWLRWLDPLHSYFGAHVSHHLFPQAPTRYSRRIEEEIQRLWPDRFHVMSITHALKLLWDTPWVYDEDGTGFVDPRRSVREPTLGYGLEKR